jgi:hypothetical protein
MVKVSMLRAMIIVTLAISVYSCRKGNVDEVFNSSPGHVENDMVLYWNAKADTVLGVLNPPTQARYFAMIQIAVHDALNAIKPKYEQFALLNTRENKASPDAAVASAAYHTIIKLNVQRTYPALAWYNECLERIPDGESKELGKALGEKAADAIIAKRSTDNFAIARQILAVPDGVLPGEYKSTLPHSLPGRPRIKSLHLWGTNMAPFVVENNYQFRPGPPSPVSSPKYVADYLEVKAKGARVAHTRSPDETEIGVFWVERASIGWNRMARNMLKNKNQDAWKTARLFALVHTAMADGITGCLEAKYHYFYWRPETAIREGDNDGNDNTTGDPAWLPSWTDIPNADPALNTNTPPLPDYPSAHGAFGGAASEVLRLFFGTDKIDVDQTSTTLPNVTRHYTSLSQASRDNCLSRIYVGYHFRKAVFEGEGQGIKIGNCVFKNQFRELQEND